MKPFARINLSSVALAKGDALVKGDARERGQCCQRESVAKTNTNIQ